ncbi:ABC transporter substrate-binding protein [Ursidibacter sp. B-7004-1]
MKILWLILFIVTFRFTYAEQLVIGTTFSPESTHHLIEYWKKIEPKQSIRIINRTSSSLERLVFRHDVEDIDIVLSSSPILFKHLIDKELLYPLPNDLRSERFVPSSLNKSVTAIAFSGYGILFNKKNLTTMGLYPPKDWEDLFDAKYANNLVMSSPSRSGTHSIILEMLFQQRGWDNGWKNLLTLSGNLSLISSRSFSVIDKVQMGVSTAGITIDSYANNVLSDSNLGFSYFPQNIMSPTFIAIHKNSKNKKEAIKFISFLLSNNGQELLTKANMDKFPLNEIDSKSPLYAHQQHLFNQSKLDYDLLHHREFLIQKLFDVSITFRLGQLKQIWKLINKKEAEKKRRLNEIRNLITMIPISEEKSKDIVFLTKLKEDKAFLHQQEKLWESFFQTKINKALDLLENIE